MMTRFPSGVWAIVLIASVLLNGMILGGVLAATLTGRAIGPGGRELAAAPPLREFGARLPDEVRQDVMIRMRESAEDARPLLVEAREANDAAMQALAAEPFDAEAARVAFERAEAARSALEMRAHEMTISLFASLPQESRENLVRRVGGEQRVFMRFDSRDDDRRGFGPQRGDGQFRDGGFGDGRFGDGPDDAGSGQPQDGALTADDRTPDNSGD